MLKTTSSFWVSPVISTLYCLAWQLSIGTMLGCRCFFSDSKSTQSRQRAADVMGPVSPTRPSHIEHNSHYIILPNNIVTTTGKIGFDNYQKNFAGRNIHNVCFAPPCALARRLRPPCKAVSPGFVLVFVPVYISYMFFMSYKLKEWWSLFLKNSVLLLKFDNCFNFF